MAKKLDSYKSYGQKLISLLVRLMFSGERVSLTELAPDGELFKADDYSTAQRHSNVLRYGH